MASIERHCQSPALNSMQLTQYLQASEFIDFDRPAVARKAKELAAECATEEELARRYFEFVAIKSSIAGTSA